MGFIKAFTGAISASFADQWKEFYTIDNNLKPTTVISPAKQKRQNNGVGENTKGSENIISNGSKIIVPEGTAAFTIQDGAITSFIAEPGGYIYNTNDPNSRSLFSGDGFFASTFGQSWERLKFGGQPASEQFIFYVNLKEIPNNRFGTSSQIYWNDGYLNNAQVGAIVRGTYTFKLVDPLLFIKNFVPTSYLGDDAKPFDFADMNNQAGQQLFTEVVSSLSAAFAEYTSDPERGGRISGIQKDQLKFAVTLSSVLETNYRWSSERGLQVIRVAFEAIDYDEETKEILKKARELDALSGARSNTMYQHSIAHSMEAAAKNEGAGGGMTGLAFMGLGMNALGGALAGMNTPGTVPGFNQPAQTGMPTQPGMPAQTGMPTQPGMPGQAPQAGTMPTQPTPTAPIDPTNPTPVAPTNQPQPAPTNQPQPAPTNPTPINQNPTPTAQPTPTAPTVDVAAELAKAKSLLDQGLITEADFTALKSKLLGL